MAKKSKAEECLNSIFEHIYELKPLATATSDYKRKSMRLKVDEIVRQLSDFSIDLDPINHPSGMFDPSLPDVAGKLVTLALLPQPRFKLASLDKFYGSGVYAIYYDGDHHAYQQVAGTETPIYVGKADPETPAAKTPVEQGTRLWGRLNDHKRTITKVQDFAESNGLDDPLKVEDFTCKALVAASNAQLTAESHLVHLFKPIWNSETNICWGMSKHGDSAGTRSNKRSPWHVLHPGVGWALDAQLRDAKTKDVILEEIQNHFAANQPYTDIKDMIDQFLEDFIQHPFADPEVE